MKESIGKCIAAGYKDQILELQGNNSYKFLANPNPSNIKIDSYAAAANSGQMYLSMASIRKDRIGHILAQLCHGIKKVWIEDILEKTPKPLTPEPKPRTPAQEKIRKSVDKQSDIPIKTSPSESRPKPVAITPKIEKPSLFQKIKSAFNRFVNFIKNLLRLS